MKIKSYTAAVLVVAALVATGTLAQHPAGHGDMNKKAQGAKTADAPYDLHYIDMMIEHHRMGIDMAKMAQSKASHAELKDLATKMADDQQKDSDQLQKWRDEWYAGRPKSDHMNMPMAGMSRSDHMNMPMSGTSKSDHANMKGMSGMNMQQMDMGKLEAASGNQFDLMFIDMIVPHHQMAIDMSQDALKKAEHAPLKTFARATIDKQQKEKAQLTKWRAAWGGK